MHNQSSSGLQIVTCLFSFISKRFALGSDICCNPFIMYANSLTGL